jgi:hypothetical protein
MIALLLVLTWAGAPIEPAQCPTVVKGRKPDTERRSSEYATASAKLSLEVLLGLAVDPRREPSSRIRADVASIASQAWKELGVVLGAAKRVGSCPDGCEDALARLGRRTGWAAVDVREVVRQSGPMRQGWSANLEADGLRIELDCRRDSDATAGCEARAYEAGQRFAAYEANVDVATHQRATFPCGRVEIESGATGTFVSLGPGRLSNGASIFEPDPQVEARASSELSDGRHGAARAVDAQFATAWAEGAPGPGIGQWIELSWRTARQVRVVTVFPGYGKSRALFFANARVKSARLTFSDGHRVDARFEDVPSVQMIDVYDDWDAKVTSVRLEILDVYPGEKYEDACISEIRVH